MKGSPPLHRFQLSKDSRSCLRNDVEQCAERIVSVVSSFKGNTPSNTFLVIIIKTNMDITSSFTTTILTLKFPLSCCGVGRMTR